MSFNLVSTGDGWFNRQGAFAGETNRVAFFYGSALDAGFQSIWSLFGTSEQAAVAPLPDAVTAFRQSDSAYVSTLSTEAQLASVLQVDRDAPLVPFTFDESVVRVVDQMNNTTQTINRPTVAGTVSVDGDNVGNASVTFSNTNIYGDPLDMTVTETLTVTCTSGSAIFTGSFQAVGEPVVATSAWNWPLGSGAQASVTAVDPAVDGTLTNSALVLFTVANTPDDWTILDGAAGATVFKGSGTGVRSGTDSVYLQSDGSQATKLAQEVALSINTVYAITFQARMNTNSAVGTLVVQLWDNTNSAVLTDDAGANLQASYALNGGGGEITTAYQLLTVFFSTPKVLPASVQVRIGYGTAATSTRQLYLSNVQTFPATPLYGPAGTGTSGPFVAVVGDTVSSVAGDTYTIAVTNSLSNQSFVWGLQRLHDLRSRGLYLPSAASPSNTIPDNLVTH